MAKDFQVWLEALAALVANRTDGIRKALNQHRDGNLPEPGREWSALARCIELVRATVNNLQEHLPRFVKIDPGPLDRVREELNRQTELLNEWRQVSRRRIEAARARHDAAQPVTFEEFARRAGYDPEKAPRELPAPGWNHLVVRRHPWRRQLFLKGRNMTVRQLVGTVKVDGWSEEEAARNVDLPVEAIREALRYAEINRDLLAAEAEYERLVLQEEAASGTSPVPR
jgi:uncharacterized protein (DUF433 family)